MKIYLFCPTYDRDGLDMFWPDSRASFEALKAPAGVEVTRVVGRDNPYQNSHRYRNTLHQFQQAQKAALEGGYDALVTFESDMIVPEDGLIKLWEVPAQVVYGVYLLRHGSNVLNAFRWIEGSPNLDQSLSLFPLEHARAKRDGYYRVSGCGNGFTLIHRETLERFPFRHWDESNYAPDWAFATDCQRAGVEQIAHFGVICGHIEENGHILWPGKDDFVNFRVKVLQDFTGTDGGSTKVFKAGTEDTISGPEAMDYVRAGFLQIIPDGDLAALAKPRNRVETAEIAAGETATLPTAKKRGK